MLVGYECINIFASAAGAVDLQPNEGIYLQRGADQTTQVDNNYLEYDAEHIKEKCSDGCLSICPW